MHIYGHTQILIYMETDTRTQIHTQNYIYVHTDRQTDRQTDRRICIYANMLEGTKVIAHIIIHCSSLINS